ncbi:MAG: DUF2157 domain-containing protein [Verrucomicrobiota bacterium]
MSPVALEHMSLNPLDQPVSLLTLRRWHREGVLDRETLEAAREQVQPASAWLTWLRAELLVAGVALVLSGAVFFFAYNWQAITRFEKMGLIGVAMAACILGACAAGVNRLGGQVLVLAGTVMTGVFLAVFGQTYQTGADAYELFTGWAALTFVWVLLARMEALWFLWLVIVQTGLVLFWSQVAHPGWKWPEEGVAFAVAAFNVIALMIRERFTPLPGRGWFRTLLLLSFLVALTMPAVMMIFDGLDDHSLRLTYVPLWLVAVAGSYGYYRLVRPDFACIALASANVAVMVVVLLGRGLFFGMDDDGLGLFFLMAMIVVGVTTGLTLWLAREHRAMKPLLS